MHPEKDSLIDEDMNPHGGPSINVFSPEQGMLYPSSNIC